MIKNVKKFCFAHFLGGLCMLFGQFIVIFHLLWFIFLFHATR